MIWVIWWKSCLRWVKFCPSSSHRQRHSLSMSYFCPSFRCSCQACLRGSKSPVWRDLRYIFFAVYLQNSSVICDFFFRFPWPHPWLLQHQAHFSAKSVRFFNAFRFLNVKLVKFRALNVNFYYIPLRVQYWHNFSVPLWALKCNRPQNHIKGNSAH